MSITKEYCASPGPRKRSYSTVIGFMEELQMHEESGMLTRHRARIRESGLGPPGEVEMHTAKNACVKKQLLIKKAKCK